jgi:putative methyltransferase
LKNQLFVYQAEVYPNTELGDPNYQDQFGIKTKRTILSEIHGKVRDASRVQEFQDIIVETATMPVSDWRRMTVFSVVTMLMHSMKLGFYVLAYLADRYGAKHVDVIEFIIESKSTSSSNLIASEVSGLFDYTDALLAGGGRGIHLPNYGDIYWDAEEGCFLRITEDIAVFYEELELLLIQFLKDRGDKPNLAELHEVLIYQRMRIPGFDVPDLVEKTFESNIPEYFEALFGTSPIDMESTPQRLLCTPTDFKGDHIRFARETILWGRKSGTLLVLVDPETTYLKADTKMVDRHAESIEGLTLFDKRNKFQGFTAKTTN